MATRVGALSGPRPLSRDVPSSITAPLLDNRSCISLERPAPSRIEPPRVTRASNFAPWQLCTVDSGRMRELALRPPPQAQQDILSTPFGATRTAQGGPGDGHETVGDVVEIDDAAAHDFPFSCRGKAPTARSAARRPPSRRGARGFASPPRDGVAFLAAPARHLPAGCHGPTTTSRFPRFPLIEQAPTCAYEKHGQYQCNPF